AQIQGFFSVPFDHLFAMPVLLEHMRQNYSPDTAVIVSPDAGGVERARAYAKRFGGSLAIIDKRRPMPNVAQIMNIIGEVDGRDCIILDDMIDTAGTLSEAAYALKAKGAQRIVAYATHPVLSGPAIDRLMQAPLEKIIVSDSIPLMGDARTCPKIEVLSIAPLLAKALRRIHLGESVSSLFV
ncbi:MAG: ribose-phosphate diphosphokinase, partial [Oxalobacteraceae bacterium]